MLIKPSVYVPQIVIPYPDSVTNTLQQLRSWSIGQSTANHTRSVFLLQDLSILSLSVLDHEDDQQKSCAQKASWIIEYSWFANIYAFVCLQSEVDSLAEYFLFCRCVHRVCTGLFASRHLRATSFCVLFQCMLLSPSPWFSQFSVSVFYTIDFFLTVYVNVDRCAYLTSKYRTCRFR